jgi:hypothetical protein
VTTWPGWQIQFLAAARILNTPPNQRLLTSWAAHASAPTCRNNPIDLSVKLSGSVDCASLPAITPKAQRYLSHVQAATAFRDEIHLPGARALLAAMQTGNPYQVSDPGAVASSLSWWGSQRFANTYLAAATGGSGGGGGGGHGVAPSTHRAWHDLQRSVNKAVPSAVRDSRRLRRQTLRDIAKVRRLGH